MSDRIHRLIIELRWPLIVLALSIVLSCALVIASWYVEHSKLQEYQQVQNRLRAAQLALNNALREASDVETYRNRFEALSARGVFGQEQRLSWVEFMTNLNAKEQLQSLDYQIASQRPVSVTSLPQANSIEVLASQVRLKMGFLHEEDLLRALEELRQSNAGFYRLETCTVKRKEGPLALTVRENLLAECKLQWITMRPHT